MEHSANKEIKTEAFSKRRCRFSDELAPGMTTFKTYTEKSCLFECALKRSADSFSCVPWEFNTLFGKSPICLGGQSQGFYLNLSQWEHDSACSDGCLPDCEEIWYNAHADGIRLMAVDECSKADYIKAAFR